jgi:hypothetical protein
MVFIDKQIYLSYAWLQQRCSEQEQKGLVGRLIIKRREINKFQYIKSRSLREGQHSDDSAEENIWSKSELKSGQDM